MPNNPPTLVGLSSSVAFGENAVNGAPALIDADVTFADPNANFAGGLIAVSGLLAEDRVSINHQGFGAGQIGLFGVNITYGGIAIGTFSGGVGGTLTISLNSAATSAAVDALIQNLAYANVSDSPTATRTLTIEIEDGDGAPMVRPAEYESLVGAANPLNVDLGQQSAPAFVDIDFDGDLDFVAGDRNGQIRVLRNDGTSYSELLGAANPFDGVDVVEYSRPAFADLDGDGDMDVVIGTSGGLLRSWRNTGGTFTELIGAANPFDGADVGEIAAPAFVDIDDDGDLDLVVGELFGTLKTFLNSGGEFTLATAESNPLSAVDVGFFSSPGFVDLDGDGDMDAIVGSNINPLTVLRNDGGVFTGIAFEENPFAMFGIASYATPAFADLDGDGDLDAVFGQNSGRFQVLENIAPLGRDVVIEVTEESDVPTLDNVAPSVDFLENAVNAAPALLDAEVDFGLGSSGLTGGKLIVSGLLPEDRISILEGGGLTVSGNTVSFGGDVIGTFSGGQGTSFVVTLTAAADATNVDALVEALAYANASQTPTASRTLHFNIVDGAGGALDGPPAYSVFPVNSLGFVPSSLSNIAPAFVDLDEDGDLDLVVGELFGSLRAYRNDGTGYVELVGTDNPLGAIDIGFNSVPAFVDLDGDGDKDLILGGDAIPGIVRTYRNDDGAYVLLGGAENPFAGVSFDRNMTPAPADVDGDGDIDLLFGSITNSTPGALRYFENDGSGFAERTGAANPFSSATFSGYPAPAWIDLDGDGDLDLAVCTLGSGFDGAMRAWRNDGGGSFTELTGSANPFGSIDFNDAFVTRPAFVDLDGDGDLDTVIGTGFNGVRTYRNDASFGPSIVVNVTAEGDVPSLSGLAGSAGFAENAVNSSPIVLDGNVAFDAGTGAMAGATLVVSGLLAEDSVSILSEGPIDVSGTSLLHLGVEIGTVAGGAGEDLTITFNGAASSAGIDALFERLAYSNFSDTPTAARSLTIQFADGMGATLAGGAKTIIINVDAENDAPVLTGLSATLGVAENQANAAPVRIDADVVFADPDGVIAGGTLTVTGLLAEDRVGIRDEGLGTGTIALFGTNVIYDGLAIGTFSGGNGGTFTVTLNAAATNEAVDALIQNLTYANSSDTPTPGRVLTLSISDSASAAVSSPLTVSVAAEGDAPLIGNLDGDDCQFAEGGAPVRLDGGGNAVVSDVDSPNFDGGSLTVSIVAGSVAAEDLLAIETGVTVDIVGATVSVSGTAIGTITSDGSNGNDLMIDFTALATPLLVQELVRALTYANANAADPDTTTRSIEIVLVDDTGGSALVTVEAAISADDAAAIAANDAVAVAEHQMATGNLFADNGSGADVDPDGPALAIAAVNGLTGSVGVPIILASGAQLTVQANGNYSYDPNGRFDYVAAAGSGAANIPGSDSFTYTLANGNTATVTVTITGVDSDDKLIGTEGDDVMFGGIGEDSLFGLGGHDQLHGGSAPDRLVGGDGDDLLDGGRGHDRLEGGAGDDILNGGDHGIDRLDGGTGADTMTGGNDNDTYVVDNAGDIVIELKGEGNDRVESTIDYDLPAHLEQLSFLGSNHLVGRGNALDNKLFGNAGKNFLNGGTGNDVIDGGAGSDRIYGSEGHDVLIGGAGHDRFHFNTSLSPGNVDRIIDYAPGVDLIHLARPAFAGVGSGGTLSANAFVQGDTPGDSSDRILYDLVSGRIFFDSDGTGAAAAILFAQVTPGTALTHGDFYVYG
jgi:VCBS repeat-containing protein